MTMFGENSVCDDEHEAGRRHACILFGGALAATVGGTLLLPTRVKAATSPEGAATFVQWLADQALRVLRSPGASLTEREATLRKLLAQGFDLQFIGRFVIGRYWRRMSPDKKAECLRLFGTYILNTYSARFGGYSGQTFEVVSARAAGKKDAVVRSLINRPNGTPVKADWRIRATGNQFRIIDISVEGVSMAVTQRSEFAAMIKNNGVDGLMAALRARSDKLPAMASR